MQVVIGNYDITGIDIGQVESASNITFVFGLICLLLITVIPALDFTP
jgi:hypothetical protein